MADALQDFACQQAALRARDIIAGMTPAEARATLRGVCSGMLLAAVAGLGRPAALELVRQAMDLPPPRPVPRRGTAFLLP